MSPLPTPQLGEITAFTINTTDLEQSLAFYKLLGFYELHRADWPFPWIQVTDGVVLIMLRKDPNPYLALTYYVKNIDAIVADLTQKGIVFTFKPKKGDPLKRYVFQSPDGLTISLVNIIEGFKQPTGPGMLQMPPEDYFKPEKYINKTIGMFGELAQPVKDLGASIAFWQLLGFSMVSKFDHNYPWAILSDGLSIIGLHQTDHFSYPAMTFFAADMKQKINKLQQAGMKDFHEESPGNIRVTTPEQQHIFLYTLGGGETTSKPLPETFTLETERLILKELTPELMDHLFENYDDSQINEFYGFTAPEQLELERSKYIGGITTYRSSFKLFLMVEKSTGLTIGRCGFHNWYDLHKRAEFGYALVDSVFYGKGYMKEALKPVLAHGFEIMNLNRVEAFVGPSNTASNRLVKGLGFTEEGVLREHFFVNGIFDDSICYRLLKSEYHGNRLG